MKFECKNKKNILEYKTFRGDFNFILILFNFVLI
nr:MAG TPA_asm: hypothetical protein [Caudoviricetes sp.]DAT49970.1 MAG TPA: hypothetical protein [Caudoviricetes sp.]DAX11879.1 MAG TPA: hypothetical protein [Bacteriophage sp.]